MIRKYYYILKDMYKTDYKARINDNTKSITPAPILMMVGADIPALGREGSCGLVTTCLGVPVAPGVDVPQLQSDSVGHDAFLQYP